MTTAPVVSITDELLAKLEEAAKAATPGVWSVQPGHYPQFIEIKGPAFRVSVVTSATDLDFSDYMKRTADAEHIARANPATVLALIARVRELEKDAARYRWWRMFFETDSADMPDAVCGVRTPNELDAAIDAAMQNPTNGTTNPHQNG